MTSAPVCRTVIAHCLLYHLPSVTSRVHGRHSSLPPPHAPASQPSLWAMLQRGPPLPGLICKEGEHNSARCFFLINWGEASRADAPVLQASFQPLSFTFVISNGQIEMLLPYLSTYPTLHSSSQGHQGLQSPFSPTRSSYLRGAQATPPFLPTVCNLSPRCCCTGSSGRAALAPNIPVAASST